MEEGKRFSQVYLERGAPRRDSVRFRNRLSALYGGFGGKYKEEIKNILRKKAGAAIPILRASGYSIESFF